MWDLPLALLLATLALAAGHRTVAAPEALGYRHAAPGRLRSEGWPGLQHEVAPLLAVAARPPENAAGANGRPAAGVLASATALLSLFVGWVWRHRQRRPTCQPSLQPLRMLSMAADTSSPRTSGASTSKGVVITGGTKGL
eukprot:EG_transcript_44391